MGSFSNRGILRQALRAEMVKPEPGEDVVVLFIHGGIPAKTQRESRLDPALSQGRTQFIYN